MRTFTEGATQLQALETDVAEAWAAYRQATIALNGDSYGEAEQECWELLQDQLAKLDRQRRSLTAGLA